MNDKILEDIKQRIGIECNRITLKHTGYTIKSDKTEPTQSKVLGKGFFPKKMKENYPRTKDGTPMIMFVQINFAEIPPMEGVPTSGLLQLYFNPYNWHDHEEVILYWKSEELQEEILDTYEEFHKNIKEDDFYLPAQYVHTMEFEKGVSYSGADDHIYEKHIAWIAEKYSSQTAEEFVKLYPVEFGSRIGGYSDFTQYDPRKKNIRQFQLLQLDSEEGINFCDCGVLHIFIKQKDLQTAAIEKSTMYVDYY